MSENLWPSMLVGLLGGGVIATAITMWSNWHIDRRARRIEHLRHQLQDLYGPLQFFASSNARLFELSKRFQDAYNKEYIQKEWSDAQETRERVRADAELTLEIANEYVELAIKNNEAVVGVLERGFALLEPDDTEVCSSFLVDFARLRVESDDEGTLRTPFEIYLQLGWFSFMPEEFIAAIDRTFKKKQSKLAELVK